MLAQFRNQDPTKPVENSEFLAQLASFGTVSGIRELNGSMGELASSFASGQALQAASLLGRRVLVAQPTGWLPEGGRLAGAVELPASAGGVAVQVVDRNGAVVRTLQLGRQGAGLARFSWDGRTDQGAAAPAGQYVLRAQVLQNGRAQAAATLVEAAVESVTLAGAGRGTTVHLQGLGTVALGDLRQIS